MQCRQHLHQSVAVLVLVVDVPRVAVRVEVARVTAPRAVADAAQNLERGVLGQISLTARVSKWTSRMT